MLPQRACVNDAALSHFGLKARQLLIGARLIALSAMRTWFGLQFGAKQIQQIARPIV